MMMSGKSAITMMRQRGKKLSRTKHQQDFPIIVKRRYACTLPSLETLLLTNSILALKKNDEAVSVDKVFPFSLLTAKRAAWCSYN